MNPKPPQSDQKPCANSNDTRDDQKAQDATGTENPKTASTPQSSGPPSGKISANQQAPIADIYDNLKLPDDMLGGVYANMASISHTGSEFCFDFIAQFFPRSAVTARVYMAAPRVPELLSSLKRSINAK